MTATDNYATLYTSVFGEPLKSLPPGAGNNLLGALNNAQFSTTTKNFVSLLHRLRDRFSGDAESLAKIKEALWLIGARKGYKWSGAYAELVALDFWGQFEEISDLKYVAKWDVHEGPDSLAKRSGQQVVDLDLRFTLQFTPIYLDVKSFIPTHYELLDGIYAQVEKKVGHRNYLLGIDGLDGSNYMTTMVDMKAEIGSGGLVDALAIALSTQQTTAAYTTVSGRVYRFNMAYPKDGENTVLTTLSFHNPYQSAFDLRYKALEYWNKLLINDASLLMFVSHPWYNRDVIGNMSGSNEIFYRSFARRVFMELGKDDATDLSTVTDSPPGLTPKSVSEKVTGIIFLDDQSVLKEGGDRYEVYIYLNPNATNLKLTQRHFDILHWNGIKRNVTIEDFEYDNY